MTAHVAVGGQPIADAPSGDDPKKRLLLLAAAGFLGGLVLGLVLMFLLKGRGGAETASPSPTTAVASSDAGALAGASGDGSATTAAGADTIGGADAGADAAGAGADGTVDGASLFASGNTHLVAKSLPAGLVFHNAAQLPQPDAELGAAGATGHQLFVAPGAAGPFEGDLLVFHSDVEPNLFRGGTSQPVRGKDGTSGMVFNITYLMWEETPGAWVGLASRSAFVEELQARAEGLEITPGAAPKINAQQMGDYELKAQAELMPIPFSEPRSGSLVNYLASPGGELPNDASLLVMSAPGAADNITMMEWLADSTTAQSIGGRDTTQLSYSADAGMPAGNSVYTWLDGGRQVVVASFGLPDDSLPEIVAGLETVDEAEFGGLVSLAGN